MESKQSMETINSKEVLVGLQNYWNKRSDSYSRSNIEELNNFKRDAWLKILLENAPKKEKLRVLDVGTGPGLFAILMTLAGHDVTAVDVSNGMLDNARQNAKQFELDINFVQIDGFKLPFNDGSFDLIVSRNVVWNIEQPKEAMKEWKRLLSKDGNLVYFDANWYLYLFDEKQREEVEYDRKQMEAVYKEKYEETHQIKYLENIARNLVLSKESRPNWDKQALIECGFEVLKIEEDMGRYVWDEKQKVQYRATPLFMVVAK
jgi:ubiquinone/menaquinone biosynthesis C-methylase UbiE